MKVLFDTNVILDLLLNRQPFCEISARVIDLSATKIVEGYVSASAITDIYYLAYKGIKDKLMVRSLLEKLLQIVTIAGVTESEIRAALQSDWSDFEDAVQYFAACGVNASYIITRNKRDYLSGEIVVVEPEEFLNILSDTKE